MRRGLCHLAQPHTNLLALLLLLTACTPGDGTAQPLPTPTSAVRSGVVVIEAADQYFNPAEMTVAPGTTVVWKDVQGTHNMVADDESFASEVLIEGESYTHIFTAPGHYRYICTLHVGAGMWAEVDVE